MNCNKCNQKKVKKYMCEIEGLILCENCKEKELKEKGNTESDNESDDESIDAEINGRRIIIHKFEIERLKRLGFSKYYFVNLTFIQEYKGNQGKTDQELVEILKEWKKPVEYNDSDTPEDDDEIFIEEKEVIKNILEELEKLNIETNEDEITRLQSMGLWVLMK
jgi:hypothetical protein